jgi:hypothetical protein
MEDVYIKLDPKRGVNRGGSSGWGGGGSTAGNPMKLPNKFEKEGKGKGKQI